MGHADAGEWCMEEKDYLVTLSTGSPDWLTSKWRITAEEKSQALNFAMLMHDDPARDSKDRWPVAMVTISYPGSNPEIDESEYTIPEPKHLSALLSIYWHSKDKLENC